MWTRRSWTCRTRSNQATTRLVTKHWHRVGPGIDSIQLVPTIEYTAVEERKLVWKQDLTIIPLSAYIYFLCFFDRSNIGNAKVLNSSTKNDMQTEIHATAYQFNIALMIFLVGKFRKSIYLTRKD